MAVSERDRHEFYETARQKLGDSEADYLMEMLPPVGWADVARRDDLDRLEQRIDRLEARVDRGFQRVDQGFAELIREVRTQYHRLVTMMMTLTVAIVGAFGGLVVSI